MAKKQIKRSPEDVKAILSKVQELRNSVGPNGKRLNAHDACKAAGVSYSTWYTWIAAKRRSKGKVKSSRTRNLPATNLMSTIQNLTANHAAEQQNQTNRRRKPVMFFAGDADDIKDVLNSMGMGSFQQ